MFKGGFSMQCSACNKLIQGDFKFCPHCGSKFNTDCSGCGKNMMLEWVTCPYCGLSSKGPATLQPPPNIQYPTSSHNHHDYHSDSSGHHGKHKKGLLGNFFRLKSLSPINGYHVDVLLGGRKLWGCSKSL